MLEFQNTTDVKTMPEFVYYNLENWFLCYYYPYMTISCQGLAFLMGVLYKYGWCMVSICVEETPCAVPSFTPYRLWNLWGTLMAGLCLPVDVFIFYKEPLGVVGTLLALVWGFIPFTILIADAAFPDKEVTVRLRGGCPQLCSAVTGF